MTARILNVTAEEYHDDPCDRPSLSASIAHVLVTRSPLHARALHPRLGGAKDGAGTKAKQSGSLAHHLLLGAGQALVVIDAEDYRTAAARTARDAAIEVGALPVLQHVYAEQAAIADILREKCAALGFLFDGRSEAVIEWHDGAVLCRSMLDHVHFDRGQIIDLKTTRSANPRECARHFVEYGYDIQYAAYTRAVAAFEPEFEGRVDMVFLFVEIEPPYAVVPARPDGALREIGSVRWSHAVELWQRCMASDHWPGYAEGAPVTLEAPGYVVAQELGNMEPL